MSESKWFIIPNLSDFTDKARAIVYNNFGAWQKEIDTEIIIEEIKENEKEEFNKILSHQESLTIIKENIKKEKNRKTKKYRYLLNDAIFADIVHQLNERMTSNIISGLVQKGLIETAFDEESNDFVFWCKKDEEEQPETD
jgi:ABC-type Fe3+-citrate transport system substrate-binding protein